MPYEPHPTQASELAKKYPNQFLSEHVFQDLRVDEFKFSKGKSGNLGLNMISQYIRVPPDLSKLPEDIEKPESGWKPLAIHLNAIVTASALQKNVIPIRVDAFHITARSLAAQTTIDTAGPSALTADNSIHLNANTQKWGREDNLKALAQEVGFADDKELEFQVETKEGYNGAHMVSLVRTFREKVERSIHELLGGNVSVEWDGDKTFMIPELSSGLIPDVQHGVVANELWPIQMVDDSPTTVLKFYFVDGTKPQKEAVRTTILQSARNDAKEKYKQETGHAVAPNNPFNFVTWEDHANVKFQETTAKGESDIRITFKGTGFHTAIGTVARIEKYAEHSMVLAGLKHKCPPSKEHRRNILHEFGHALGLRHEHQGPAAQECLELDKESVKQKYGERAKDFLGRIDADGLWNYTKFDPESIMTYPIPGGWQTQKNKIEIGLALTLSKYDQATITLMYPPDVREEFNAARFRNAMATLHLDSKTAGEIIQKFTGDPEGDVADRLTKLRDRFDKSKTDGKLLYNSNIGILRGIDPASLRQSGISEFVGEMTKNRLFQSIMKNIVYRSMVQQGIPTNVSIPGAMQTEATRLIASLSMHDGVGQLVRQHRAAFSGDKSVNSTGTTAETLAY
ncbi:hypothetical protein HD554DRAFT_2173261 [Boletus coccyginus]|nr:hypothetical protein HD554DRAFT_2173261 [Boletus coccyginus]